MSRLNRDDLDKYVDSDIHPSTRTISLDESVDFASCRKLIKQLRILDSASNSPITIHFHCEGGDVSWGFGMYDAITMCRSEVIGIAIGECSSMATVILQACDVRLVSPHALVMAHKGTTSLGDVPEDEAENAWADNKKSGADADHIIYEAVNKKKPMLKHVFLSRLTKGIYARGQDAVDWGLVDAVVGDA